LAWAGPSLSAIPRRFQSSVRERARPWSSSLRTCSRATVHCDDRGDRRPHRHPAVRRPFFGVSRSHRRCTRRWCRPVWRNSAWRYLGQPDQQRSTPPKPPSRIQWDARARVSGAGVERVRLARVSAHACGSRGAGDPRRISAAVGRTRSPCKSSDPAARPNLCTRRPPFAVQERSSSAPTRKGTLRAR
jgi:hypothetical protein